MRNKLLYLLLLIYNVGFCQLHEGELFIIDTLKDMSLSISDISEEENDSDIIMSESFGNYFAKTSLSLMLHGLMADMDYFLRKEDIDLRNDPAIQVVFSSSGQYTKKDRAKLIIQQLKSLYDFTVETKTEVADYIVISDVKNVKNVSYETKETGINRDSTSYVYKNVKLTELINHVHLLDRKMLMIDTCAEDLTNQYVTEMCIGRYNLTLSLNNLTSENRLAEYLKDIGFGITRKLLPFTRVKITD